MKSHIIAYLIICVIILIIINKYGSCLNKKITEMFTIIATLMIWNGLWKLIDFWSDKLIEDHEIIKSSLIFIPGAILLYII